MKSYILYFFILTTPLYSNLDKVVSELMTGNYIESNLLLDDLEIKSIKSNNFYKLCWVYFYRAKYYEGINQPVKADLYYMLCEKYKNYILDSDYWHLYYNWAIISKNLGNYKKCNNFIDSLYKYSDTTVFYTKLLNLKGSIYYAQNKYVQAEGEYLKALKYAKDNIDSANILNNLFLLQWKLYHKFDVKSIKRSLELTNNKIDSMITNLNYVLILNENNPEDAKFIFNSIFIDDINDSDLLYLYYFVRGKINKDYNDYLIAFDYAENMMNKSYANHIYIEYLSDFGYSIDIYKRYLAFDNSYTNYVNQMTYEVLSIYETNKQTLINEKQNKNIFTNSIFIILLIISILLVVYVLFLHDKILKNHKKQIRVLLKHNLYAKTFERLNDEFNENSSLFSTNISLHKFYDRIKTILSLIK